MKPTKQAKPVKAWAHVRDGKILTGVNGVIYWDKESADREKFSDSVVRVEIRVIGGKK